MSTDQSSLNDTRPPGARSMGCSADQVFTPCGGCPLVDWPRHEMLWLRLVKLSPFYLLLLAAALALSGCGTIHLGKIGGDW